MAENIGKVISISGPAVDIQFEESKMPAIYQALRIVSEGFNVPAPMDVVVEVQQHLGEGRVRCIAMVATEGLVRGTKAIEAACAPNISSIRILVPHKAGAMTPAGGGTCLPSVLKSWPMNRSARWRAWVIPSSRAPT